MSINKVFKKINKINRFFIITTCLILLSGILTFTPSNNVYAGDDYILENGFLGAIAINNTLVELKAYHNYFFTFKTTDTISLQTLKFQVWTYDTPPHSYDYNYSDAAGFHMVAHFDVSIYQGSGTQDVSQSNPLIKIWSEKLEIINATYAEYTIVPNDYLGNKITTKSNAIVAISYTPSINVIVNASETVYTMYEEVRNNDMIFALTESLTMPASFNIGWVLEKGSISQDIDNPAADISIFDPSTISNALAVEFGIPPAAMGIGFYALFLLSATMMVYKYEIDLSASLFSAIGLGIGIIFASLNVIPLWFALPSYLIFLGLMLYDRGVPMSNGE